MKKIDMFFDKMFHYLAALSFCAVSICTLIQVVTRYTPGISAPWTDELTRLFFMYTIMFGSPMAIKYAEYAVIDVITVNIHGTANHIIQIMIHALVAGFCVVGAKQANILLKTGFRTVSTSLQISMIFFYVVPVCIFILTMIFCIVRIIGEIVKIRKGEQ